MRATSSQEAIDEWIRVLEETGGINGESRRWRYLTWLERTFLVSLCLLLLAVFSYQLFYLITDGGDYAIVHFATIIITIIFSVGFAVYGVPKERPCEMFCCLMSCILIGIVFIWIALHEMSLALNVRIVRNGQLLICACAYWVLAVPVMIMSLVLMWRYQRNRHTLIRTVVDRRDLMEAANTVYKFKAVLFLDVLMVLSTYISLVITNMVGFDKDVNACLLGVGIPLGLIYVLLCYKLMVYESDVVFWTIMALSLYEPACILVVVVLLTYEPGVFHLTKTELYTIGYCASVALFAAAVRMYLLVLLLQMRRNFGQGLSNLMFRKERSSSIARPISPNPSTSATYRSIQ